MKKKGVKKAIGKEKGAAKEEVEEKVEEDEEEAPAKKSKAKAEAKPEAKPKQKAEGKAEPKVEKFTEAQKSKLTKECLEEILAGIAKDEQKGAPFVPKEYHSKYKPALGPYKKFVESHPDKIAIAEEERHWIVVKAGDKRAGQKSTGHKWKTLLEAAWSNYCQVTDKADRTPEAFLAQITEAQARQAAKQAKRGEAKASPKASPKAAPTASPKVSPKVSPSAAPKAEPGKKVLGKKLKKKAGKK